MILPGDSVPLTVYFSTRTYLGLVTKRPRVFYNNDDSFSYVTITADVIRYMDEAFPLGASVDRILFPFTGSQHQLERTVVLTNFSDDTIMVSPIALPDHRVAVDLPGPIAPGQSGDLTISVFGLPVTDGFQQSLVLETSGPVARRYTIEVERRGS